MNLQREWEKRRSGVAAGGDRKKGLKECEGRRRVAETGCVSGGCREGNPSLVFTTCSVRVPGTMCMRTRPKQQIHRFCVEEGLRSLCTPESKAHFRI